MVGLAGTVGSVDGDRGELTAGLQLFGDEAVQEHHVDDTFVTAVFHQFEAEPQPVTLPSSDAKLWVWGNAYGYLHADGRYVSKQESDPDATTAEYCRRLYADHGWAFVAGLNGSFVGVVHDSTQNCIRLFTDRLGSRPMHYTVLNGGVVFSTQLRGLCSLLSDRLSFDEELAAEYLSVERTLGLKTPIAGVERAHPGAVTTIDTETGAVDIDVQWQPVHDPLDQSFEMVVDRLTETLQSAVAERYDPDAETGVLLSGGSDSRLLLGALPDRNVSAYHINDWENREARIAERIADTAGKPFTYLERDGDHYQRSLDFNGQISNYTSWFQHGHASGFASTLREECDVLMTGHYSDTLFKNNYLPYRGLLLPGTSIEVPLYLEQQVESVDDLVEMYLGTKFHNRKHLRAPPDYLSVESLDPVLREHIRRVDGGVEHHGVRHASVHDAAVFGECYPLTNTSGRLFFDVLLQTAPYRNPFLDVRLVELMTKIPLRFRLRKNLVNAAVERVQPALADLSHPNTNLPLRYPFALHYLTMQANWLVDKLKDTTKPEPYYREGSWPDWDELLRQFDIVGPVLDDHEDVLEAVEWIDADAVRDDYARHMAGEDRFDELAAIASFLSMPATRTLLQADTARKVVQ